MKLKLWFSLSVALNAVLIILLLNRAGASRDTDTLATANPARPQSMTTVQPEVKTPSSAKSNSAPTSWVDALREAGIADKLIAAVAAADFEQQWQKRFAALTKQFRQGEISENEFERFIAAHDTGLEAQMRATLGEAAFRDWDHDRALGGFDLESLQLSGPETDALYDLQKHLHQQRSKLQTALLNGEIDEAALERETEANYHAYEKQLKTTLGDERYASLQPGDSAAGDLRRNLARAKASDAQVEAVMQARQEWDTARSKMELELRDEKISAEEYEQQIRALDTARDQAYQQALGAEGWVELQKNEDSRYQNMQRYAKAWGLTGDDINHLYAALRYYEGTVRDYQKQAKEVETQGQPVDWDAVQNILRDYSRQTDTALQKYLGEERFNQLKRSGVLSANP